MKVLVTGGAGFIGSRLVGRLLARGDDVLVVDDLSLGRLENLAAHRTNSHLRVETLDICTPQFLASVRAAPPELVFHLAANSDISRGTSDPTTDLQRTFLTTFHTLEAMRQVSCDRLIFASTSAIYGEVGGDVTEDHGPLAPISLYGAAKLGSEAYISAYAHLFKMHAWVFRFPNVVGPNLTHGAVHDFVRRLRDDPGKLKVLGDGTQEKPYLHVDDLLDAILLAVTRPADPVATYNIAGEGATRVSDIAEMVREEMGLPGAVIEYGSGNRGWPGDVPRFSYDTTRIHAAGWRPTRTSDEAVRAAIRAEVERCKR